MTLRTTFVSLAALLVAGPALAQCAIDGAGSVRILSNDFEALRLVNAGAQECASDAVTVEANATSEHKSIQVPALSGDPAEYTVAVVANNSIVPLLGEDLIRPLDDLVAQYGGQLSEQQLIRIDGKIMAIAFMANGQHLMLRPDLLEQAGVEPPTSWEGVMEAAQVLRDQGILENPLGASNKAGWDLAAEFVNMYLGTGAEFFEPGTATLAIDNEQGRLVLETIRGLQQYMSPENVTWDTDAIGALWSDGSLP
jgi:ABC-type glycerol-3-phosphate transport system substrate-binding protein